MKANKPSFYKIRNGRLFVGMVMIILFVLFIPDQIIAQPELWDGQDSQDVPIDGGLGILAAVGGAYAIKKLRNKE